MNGLVEGSDDERREATQLEDLGPSRRRSLQLQSPTASVAPPCLLQRSSSTTVPRRPITIFWQRHVAPSCTQSACRDHFALERTFLGYLRTSLGLSFLAVIIAQFLRLQHADKPDPVFGFFVLGIPLACLCIVTGIVVILLGFYRFWKQQNAILRGKVHAGGWELYATGVLILMVIMALFALVIAVDTRRED